MLHLNQLRFLRQQLSFILLFSSPLLLGCGTSNSTQSDSQSGQQVAGNKETSSSGNSSKTDGQQTDASQADKTNKAGTGENGTGENGTGPGNTGKGGSEGTSGGDTKDGKKDDKDKDKKTSTRKPKKRFRPVDPTGTNPITFDDLKLEIKEDMLFKDEMLTDRVKSLVGKKVRVRGFLFPGQPQRAGITKFPLMKNTQCKFGRGAQFHHNIQIALPGNGVEFRTRPMTIEGTLEIKPLNFEKWTFSIYKLTNAKLLD